MNLSKKETEALKALKAVMKEHKIEFHVKIEDAHLKLNSDEKLNECLIDVIIDRHIAYTSEYSILVNSTIEV